MRTTARVLKLFLASPDDVKEERLAAEQVVDDIDKFIGTDTTYYYNVVTLLDRLLYSPAAVRKFFVRELRI